MRYVFRAMIVIGLIMMVVSKIQMHRIASKYEKESEPQPGPVPTPTVAPAHSEPPPGWDLVVRANGAYGVRHIGTGLVIDQFDYARPANMSRQEAIERGWMQADYGEHEAQKASEWKAAK